MNVICPTCSGKRIQSFPKTPLGLLGPCVTMACVTCLGKGGIDEAFAKRIKHGQFIRAARIRAGRTVEEEATRLKITPRQVTDLENGLPIEGGLV